MNTALVLSAVLSIIGVLTLSEATKGVGFLALAVLFAVVARVEQAHDHFQSTRLDLSPNLLRKPSKAAFAILWLAFAVALFIVVLVPIFNEAAELQRARDSIRGRD